LVGRLPVTRDGESEYRERAYTEEHGTSDEEWFEMMLHWNGFYLGKKVFYYPPYEGGLRGFEWVVTEPPLPLPAAYAGQALQKEGIFKKIPLPYGKRISHVKKLVDVLEDIYIYIDILLTVGDWCLSVVVMRGRGVKWV